MGQSEKQNYSGLVNPDIAEQVEEKRAALGDISKSEAVERALREWTNRPTWRDSALNAATNLGLLAVVAFVTGATTNVLTTLQGTVLAYVLLAIGATVAAILELERVARRRFDVRVGNLLKRGRHS